jgi:hypothetical protein
MKLSPLPITFFENTDSSLGWAHDNLVFFGDIAPLPSNIVLNNCHYLITSEQDWLEVAGDSFWSSLEISGILRPIAPITTLLHDEVRGAINFENTFKGGT